MNQFKKIIPSLFTLANLCFGFLAILVADFYYSPIFLFVCLLCDALDGALARKLGVQSEIGKELDSLADMVSFGLAPAYLYHLMAPIQDSLLSYIAPSFIIIGSALRLAKFNLLPEAKYFTGLPTPANAIYYIGLILGLHFNNPVIIEAYSNPVVYLMTAVIFSTLCVSGLKMFSLKGLEKNIEKNKYQFILLFLFLGLLFINIQLAIPIGVLFYVVLSIFYTLALKLE